ncbi:attM/aiiB family protein [alpha proteobacterium U9-1i]|nr:attM/aiiB family protein [alpha proteobacterium U9-1i]
MRRNLFLASALLLVAACTPPAQEAATPEIQLYALDCGRANFSDIGVFADDGSMNGQARELIVPCYLIRHPNGDLLWDTGLPEALADMPNGFTPEGFPATLTVPVRLSAQLAQLNLTPADIEYVSVSHYHSDHSGNLNMFASSNWIVDAEERSRMFGDEGRAGQEFPNYNQLENANTTRLEGDADFDVFGDGSVTVIQAPGHTPGHTILRVNLANAGPLLITGDMYHLAESRERRLVPSFNFDRPQTLASMDKIDALEAAGVRVIREHVPEDFAALPRFPEALN